MAAVAIVPPLRPELVANRQSSWTRGLTATLREHQVKRSRRPSTKPLRRDRVLAMNKCRWSASPLGGDLKIKTDAHERFVESGLMDLCGVGHALDRWDQVVARAEGKVIVQVLVAINVDLRGELTVARRGDEEVDVRRPLAVAAHFRQQCLGV